MVLSRARETGILEAVERDANGEVIRDPESRAPKVRVETLSAEARIDIGKHLMKFLYPQLNVIQQQISARVETESTFEMAKLMSDPAALAAAEALALWQPEQGIPAPPNQIKTTAEPIARDPRSTLETDSKGRYR